MNYIDAIDKKYPYFREGFPPKMLDSEIKEILCMIADNINESNYKIYKVVDPLLSERFFYIFYDNIRQSKLAKLIGKGKYKEKDSKLKLRYNRFSMISTTTLKLYRVRDLIDNQKIWNMMKGYRVVCIKDDFCCQNCKSKHNSMIFPPYSLDKFPPYRDCQSIGDEEFSCRCGIEVVW